MSATDDWHMMIVAPEDPEDPETLSVTLLHRDDCPVSITHRIVEGKPEITKTYECGTQATIDDETGYWGMFASDDTRTIHAAPSPALEQGYWWIRPWVEKIIGPDWTEYDGGWEVVRANDPDKEN